MKQTHPLKKIIGASLMVIGIAGLFFSLLPFWLLLIYPSIALSLAAVALVRLCSRSPSPWVPRAMESLARIFLAAATLTALPFVCILVSEIAHGAVSGRISDWLCLGSLLIAQFLWFPRFRSRPLAALVIAFASSVPTVQSWGDGPTS